MIGLHCIFFIESFHWSLVVSYSYVLFENTTLAVSAYHPYYKSVHYLKPKTLYHIVPLVTPYLEIDLGFF